MADMLPPQVFAGTLGDGRRSCDVRFTARVGEDCRLALDLDPVAATSLTLDLLRPDASDRTADLELRGFTDGGRSILSDGVSVVGWQRSDCAMKAAITASVATLSIPVEDAAELAGMRLWMRGFRSFRNVPIETPLGLLDVHGDREVASSDDLTGLITIEAGGPEPGVDWFGKADGLLRHIHRGLALARGGRLQTPRLDRWWGGTVEHTFHAGEGFDAELPVIHWLHHGPFLRALVDRYFRAGPLPEVLWGALGWTQPGTNFDELRFMTGMIALEAIVEWDLPERSGTTLPRDRFKALLKELRDAVAASGLDEEAREVFAQRLSGLNRRSFPEKLRALFGHYGISREDFDEATLKELVVLRNEIVHRGAFPEGADQWRAIVLVRELVTRILLAEIGFGGRYICHVGGHHDREFVAHASDFARRPDGG